ncbi:hypothetical protein J2S74_002965 [Evansella vedderi]|uniref:Uncharacterized protein n=1 Tax=Evansella vedderi TaxID=38282 RepID=A0ABT9ZWJ1_9BACI|nr:hypothetical protein [Evansella vedderi]MDQ0255583.1 hypothetical protein [Evansella vedderi]
MHFYKGDTQRFSSLYKGLTQEEKDAMRGELAKDPNRPVRELRRIAKKKASIQNIKFHVFEFMRLVGFLGVATAIVLATLIIFY